jgi:type VI protein secretion system component Hcp
VVGVKNIIYTVRISNAHVVDVTQQLEAVSAPGQPLDGIESETVSFTFGTIEITDPIGQETASDDIP